MKKLVVNQSLCIGCGACIGIDDEHFDFDNDTSLSKVISNENLESNNLRNAIDSCPVNAISIEDGEDCDCDCEDCTGDEDCSCCENCQCHEE